MKRFDGISEAYYLINKKKINNLDMKVKFNYSIMAKITFYELVYDRLVIECDKLNKLRQWDDYFKILKRTQSVRYLIHRLIQLI